MRKEKRFTVGEAAAMAGVSVRTLHHYDEIGLLTPADVSEAGYRLYGEKEMRRLSRILFFRELEFSLGEIRAIMAHPGFDEREAMKRQLSLMKKKRERLDRLIDRLEQEARAGEKPDFAAFDERELIRMKNEYAEEVRARWGDTKAYAQSEKKHAAYGKADFDGMQAEMDALMAGFAALRGSDPAGEEAQAQVRAWRDCITKWHYDCTDEILDGLGKMYVCDERFMKNIDRHGEGTAKMMSDAIAAYIDAKLA